jgi:hypothetical protein
VTLLAKALMAVTASLGFAKSIRSNRAPIVLAVS